MKYNMNMCTEAREKHAYLDDAADCACAKMMRL